MRDRIEDLTLRERAGEMLKMRYLVVVCAWCGVQLDVKWLGQPLRRNVSHGICHRCRERWQSTDNTSAAS
jgi:hypothetical protein